MEKVHFFYISRINLASFFSLIIFFLRLNLVMYKTIFVVNIILHMCLQHSNTL